jgi:hypothetical protein
MLRLPGSASRDFSFFGLHRAVQEDVEEPVSISIAVEFQLDASVTAFVLN